MGSLCKLSFLCLVACLVLLSLTIQGDAGIGEQHQDGNFHAVVNSLARKLMQTPNAAAPQVKQNIDCASACAFRCSKSQEHEDCLRYCGTCCGRCQCVPPGTYGNREACGPCYANWKTHGGRPKCP